MTQETFQERVPRKIYRLQLSSDDSRVMALSRAVLVKLGFSDNEIVGSGFSREILEVFEETPGRLAMAKKLFDRLQLSGLEVSQRSLAPKDWLLRWKAQWRPSRLTKKLDVVPVWCKDKYKAHGRDHILMDTLLSFGTGLHETTRIVAQFIEDKRARFQSFLDIGTGTGILSFVAMKNGAQTVTGIDIGSLSVQAAQENMKANNLYFNAVQADIAKWRPGKKFDFVAANLITDDLIKYGRRIASFVKEGGWLAVSGVSLSNLKRLREAYAQLPLKCLKLSKGAEWSGLLYQKKK